MNPLEKFPLDVQKKGEMTRPVGEIGQRFPRTDWLRERQTVVIARYKTAA